MRRKKGKPLPLGDTSNFYSYHRYGFGLWEIWYDAGEGTPAFPYKGVPGDGLDGTQPVRFLFDTEAAQRAKVLARQRPERRYMVKLAR